MKKRFFLLLTCFLFINAAKSQNCFGQFNSEVASLACINYQFGWDLSYTAANSSTSEQHIFAYDLGNGKRVQIPSFFMMDKNGKAFNIHQYGFKISDMIIEVVYKIIRYNEIADIAIVVDGQPFFHKETLMSENKGDDLRVITDMGNYSNESKRFSVILHNSDLVGFQLSDSLVLTLVK